MLNGDRAARVEGEHLMGTWSSIVQLAGRVPPGAWMVLAAANLAVTLVTSSTARRRMRRAGERAADPQLVAGRVARTRDTALTVASLIPAALFWAMVLAGSFHGLIAFGRTVLGWQGGWEYLVPGTLDGVSVTFAFLAFRAMRMRKAPDRCYRVVWGAAAASATVNFAYEYAHSGHNIIAGGYLALLSLFGMVMLHEFLAQFEEGVAYVKRSNPKFGLRWVTWPTNTFCAAVAWRNYPPAEGTEASILNAVANLGRVRALKQAARDAKVVSRHQQALAAARRREELEAAAAGAEAGSVATSSGEEQVNKVGGPAPTLSPPVRLAEVPVEAPEPVSEGGPARPAPTRPPKLGKDDSVEPQPTGMRVPSTAATVLEWANLWVKMCSDPEFGLGPLNDDDVRARYGLTAKQLRNVRHAAMSGALRERAVALGVELPPGYVDNPANGRVDGHDMAGSAA
jgi:hypothetical protein